MRAREEPRHLIGSVTVKGLPTLQKSAFRKISIFGDVRTKLFDATGLQGVFWGTTPAHDAEFS